MNRRTSPSIALETFGLSMEAPAQMKFLKSEAGAMVLWALASLLGAAILSPWLYSAGKALAAHANANEANAFIEWLGAACDRAKFKRFFSRALMLTALLLLPVLIRRVRNIGKEQGSGRIMDLQKLGAQQSALHVTSAFIIAGGLLWAIGYVLVVVGVFAPETDPVKSSRILSKCLAPAVMVAFIEEWLFRGIVLGLWLRTSGPIKATIYSSLLFAFLHFLKPPGGVSDPTSAFAGFELLSRVLLHFTDPQFFVTDFLTLTIVGMILCWARLKTHSLWFSIGLHAGWVFAYQIFNLYHDLALTPRTHMLPDSAFTQHPLYPWGVGDNLRSGIIPLITLLVTAWICSGVIRLLMRKQKGSEGQSV